MFSSINTTLTESLFLFCLLLACFSGCYSAGSAPSSSLPLAKESEAQVIARTLQVENLSEQWDSANRVSDYLCSIAKHLGYGEVTVTDKRIIEVSPGR